MIYLDHAATTPMDSDLAPILTHYGCVDFGNPGSPYNIGRAAKNAVEKARESVATSLGARNDQIIFTSGGSEANTLAILGLADRLLKTGNTHIVTTEFEHPSVLRAMDRMRERGFSVTYVKPRGGRIDENDVARALQTNTGLVSVMHVNNETGATNSIGEIYELCRSREIFFHSDCVQSYGTEAVNLCTEADFISISGHKVGAPKGIGCLAAKYPEFLTPVICGGKQEFSLRPGTENVPAIVALGAKAQDISRSFETPYLATHIEKLHLEFTEEIKRFADKNSPYNFLGERVHFHQPDKPWLKSGKIVSLRIDGVDAESLMLMLESREIYVSAGAACCDHKAEPSHVLKAIGLTDEQARSTIRVSFSPWTTLREVADAARAIVECSSALLGAGEA